VRYPALTRTAERWRDLIMRLIEWPLRRKTSWGQAHLADLKAFLRATVHSFFNGHRISQAGGATLTILGLRRFAAMSLAEALTLFRRLGVNVEDMSRGEFRISYFALAKRYHPDRNPHGAELMANINAARAAILNSYRKSAA
jgi:hypothetical protein